MTCALSNGTRFFSFRTYVTNQATGSCGVDSQTDTRVHVSVTTSIGNKRHVHCRATSVNNAINVLNSNSWQTDVVTCTNPGKVEFIIEENSSLNSLPSQDTLRIQIITHRRNLPDNKLQNMVNGHGPDEELHPTFSTSSSP